MPIFDQGYQHWHGTLSGHAWRWLAITRQGVRVQLKKRGTKWTVVSAFAPAVMLAAALVVWGLLEQGSSLLDSITFLHQGLPEELRQGPRGYRSAFWTMAFDVFFRIETFFAMALVATVGPDLISQDLRFNAMPLYLSRPLRRVDYFLGKLGVIGFFLALVAVLPAVAAYLLGFAFSFELSVLRDTGRLLPAAIGFGAVVAASGGTLMLAISSLARNSRLVAALWVGLWLVGGQASRVLERTVGRDWCPIVSYTRNLDRIRESLLGTPAARDQFLDLRRRTIEAAQEAAQRASPFGRSGRRRGGLFTPPPPPTVADPSSNVPAPLKMEADTFPWAWSAGVLAGLFVLSIWTLSTRVRALDRLK